MDSGTRSFGTLSELLAAVREQSTDGGLSVAALQEMAGARAFGPLVLLPALLAVTPLSGIPTVPSILGTLIMLVSAQAIVGRRSVWLPRRLSNASVDRRRVETALGYVEPVARRIDRVVRRRLVFATEGIGLRLAAAVCFITAATMPPLEIMPFAATSAGSVIAIFGLAVTLHDGLLMLAAGVLLVLLSIAGYMLLV